jgi:GTP-binding protein YchF
MNLSVGIVGLPNVGKSTLFNALLKKQAALAANYPFATIEPNVGIVAVPDARLQKLAEVVAQEISPSTGSGSSVLPPLRPATVEFVDIAGLVKGAAEGAGLGNKFLSHIREVSVIAHVVRAFEDPDVIKEGAVDPKSDYQTINMELMFADLSTLEKAAENRKIEPVKKTAVLKAIAGINEGKPVRSQSFTDEEKEALHDLFLISAKPEIVVLNVDEDSLSQAEKIMQNHSEILEVSKDKFVVVCAKIESELAALDEEEQKEYLKDLGLEASGLERLIQTAYHTLGLISFLTAGEKEVRAWTINQGETAQSAAGAIHTDFIKKFIKAEVVGFDDYITNGGRKKAREVGKARLEGKEYIVKDGDVIEFKIGA